MDPFQLSCGESVVVLGTPVSETLGTDVGMFSHGVSAGWEHSKSRTLEDGEMGFYAMPPLRENRIEIYHRRGRLQCTDRNLVSLIGECGAERSMDT